MFYIVKYINNGACVIINRIKVRVKVRVKVLSAAFIHISVISWWSVLLVEETGVPGENHRPAASLIVNI